MLNLLPQRSKYSIAVIILGLMVIGTMLFFPDAPLYLRTQILPTDEGNAVTKTLTWEVPDDTPLGQKTMTIKADDGKGGILEKVVNIKVEAGAVEIHNVQIQATETSANFTFQTNRKLKGGNLHYDVRTENFRGNKDYAVQQSIKDHAIALDDLHTCTTYNVQLAMKHSVEGAPGATDAVRTFTTTGCAGGAAVQGIARQDISQTQGGTVGLNNKIDLSVPAGFAPSDATFQIHQLDREAALAALGTPDGLSPVSGLYQLDAFAGIDSTLKNFAQPITVTLHYTPAENTELASLALFRHDGSSWQKLNNCTVQDQTGTITCTTVAFSAVTGFAVGGSSVQPSPEPTITPTPTTLPSSPTPTPPSSGGSGSGNGGNDGGGGGSSGEEEPVAAPVKEYAFAAASNQQITGKYAGVVPVGSISIVKLTATTDTLARDVKVPKGDYTFYLRAKHDRPGPVTAVIYVNNKAWKVIKLDKNDNQFRTHKVGILKNFSGGKIHFRLLSDAFDRNDPANEDKDRNLFVEAWGLTTGTVAPKNLKGVPMGTGGSGGSGAGTQLLPGLNETMKQVGIAPTREVWRYYAWRVTRPAKHPAAITTQQQLLEAMRFWQDSRPLKPYGEIR